MDQELKQRLAMLQESDFAADDMKLYLDTHPDDTAMLMNYCMHVQKSAMLRSEIESHFGYPLSAQSAAFLPPPFKWINSPWPWCSEWPGEDALLTAKGAPLPFGHSACGEISQSTSLCEEETTKMCSEITDGGEN